MQTGNITTRDKLTGNLWFQRTSPAYVDLGNVLLVKQNLDTGIVEQITWSGGRGQVTHEEPGNIKPKWTAKLDSRMGEALRLLNLATVADSYITRLDSEATLAVTNFALTSGTRATFYLNITMENNGDYTFSLYSDAALTTLVAIGYAFGTLSIEQDTSLVENDDSGINATFHFKSSEYLSGGETDNFTYVLHPSQRYTLIAESFVRGTAKIALQDQNAVSSSDNSKAPKHELSFPAELRVTDRGDMTGEKFNEFELELLATGDVTIDSRE